MAGFQINPNDIAKASESGYSDTEIAEFLSARAPDQFKQAREAGYDDKEILAHLSGDRAEKPSGVLAGVRQGAANVISGVAETGKQFLGTDNEAATAASKTIAPKDYKGPEVVPENGKWYDPRTYNWRDVPQAIAEAAPGMAVDVAAARLGARVHPLAGLGAGVASYLLRTRGDTSKQNAAIRTGDENATPELQDKARALATGAVEAVPQAIGLTRFLPGANKVTTLGAQGMVDATKKLATTAAVEGGVGGAQSAISQAGATVGTDKGLTVNPNEVASGVVTSAATGGLLAAPRAGAEARNAQKYRKFGGDNKDAASAFANRVSEAADGATLNTKNSFEAVRTADEAVRDELKAAAKPLKNSLDTETADALKRAGKGRTLSDADLKAIDANTTPDVALLARTAHVASMLKQEGDFGNGEFVGGIANTVGKRISAIQNAPGATASALLGAAGLAPHATSMFAYAPSTLAAIGGAYAGMRSIDALSGNRSPAKSFVNQFADGTTPTRIPQPKAPPQSFAPPPGVSVPQVTPLAKPWGQVPPMSLLPSAKDNLQIHEGVAKLVQGIQKDRQNQFANEAQPLLERLAAANKPAPAAPQAPPPIDPLALPKDMLARAKVLTGGLRNTQDIRERETGRAAVDRVARESHMIDEVGGIDAVSNPQVGKIASQLVISARALQQLMRQPEAEGATPEMPSPPLASQPAPAAPAAPSSPAAPGGTGPAPAPVPPVNPASPLEAMVASARGAQKITKKNGKVHEEPRKDDSSDYTGDYAPLGDKELWGKGMSDQLFAAQEASKPHVEMKEQYANNVVMDRTKRRRVLAELSGDASLADQQLAADLLEQLNHVRRGATAAKAIKHYTEQMSPEMRAAVRKRMDSSFINSMWSK